ENIGKTARRVGQPPKLLMIYRADEPFTKVTSSMYVDPQGRNCRVEILGDGQQFVAFAEHPDTKQPYTWKNKIPLSEVDPQKLPVITQKQAVSLVEYFESLVPKTWTRKSSTKETQTKENTASGAENDDVLQNMEPKSNISEERLKEELAKLSSADYEEWKEVGMALYHQYDGSEVGFKIWDEWSKTSGGDYETDKKNPNHPLRKWKSFEMDLSRGKAVTVKTILWKAQKAGGSLNVLDQFLQRYVYVANTGRGAFVHDLQRPPHQEPIVFASFREYEADKEEEVEVPNPTIKEPHRTVIKRVPTVNRWLKHSEKIKVVGTKYLPTRQGERLITDNFNDLWINEFYMPEFPLTKKTDQLGVFAAHMKYLFHVPMERDWFIGWLAFNIQHPEQRIKTLPLHIALEHGTGRGWVVNLLDILLGDHNVKRTKIDELYNAKGGATYNEFLDRSLVCAIEEVREGAMKYTVSEHIRDILIEDKLNLNVKFGKKGTQRVYTNFFFMSNHPDALVLKPKDRRVNVFRGIYPPNDERYYQRLYHWLGKEEQPSEGIIQLYWYLRRYDLSNFFHGDRSIDNEARAVLIENNMTETEDAFWQVVNSGVVPKHVTTDEMMTMMCRVIAASEGDDDDESGFGITVDKKQVKKLLQEIGRRGESCWLPETDKVRAKGKTARPWIIDKEYIHMGKGD
ncbi:PriCT-2 domain-containing protein, partial [Candidatus Pacearchaeota archaeon]|nr:PriCT-2 domain-containing protein [Candidatus Pacearchaeota archaeon]